MRALVGSVAAACSLFAGAAFAEPGTPSPPPIEGRDLAAVQAWADENLHLEGWLFLGFSTPGPNVVLWYVSEESDATSKPPMPREWMRSESATGGGSLITRTDVDCVKRTARDVEQVFYQANNLHGRITNVQALNGPPEPAGPGSIRETLIDRVCRDAR